MKLVTEQIKRITGVVSYTSDLLDALTLEDTEDVALNPDGVIWRRGGKGWEKVQQIDVADAEQFIDAVALLKDKVIAHDNPILETVLPTDGSRFTAIFPPITTAACCCIRTGRSVRRTLLDYDRAAILTDAADQNNTRDIAINDFSRADFVALWHGRPHIDILERAIYLRKNILIVGSTGSGKTRLMDAFTTAFDWEDRVVFIEDTAELICDAPNSVGLLTSDELGIDHTRCLRTAMRMRPKRVLLGEARGAEVLALLKAWNTGHPGGLVTIHANGALEGLTKLEQYASEATTESQAIRIAHAVDIVVYIEEDPSRPAGRKVREVLAVTGYNRRDQCYEYAEL